MTEAERQRIIENVIADCRPLVAAHGGDLSLHSIEETRVRVQMTGRCMNCALAGQTLGAIRRRLTAALGEPLLVVPYSGD
ncbi:NifU family protein [Zavarzinia sp.]|uniref:NifU family protein n=1 Tax=Zavarzinia sp. TaxID=2027920 RepID=UPI00356B22C9